MTWPKLDPSIGIPILVLCGVVALAALALWFWPDRRKQQPHGAPPTFFEEELARAKARRFAEALHPPIAVPTGVVPSVEMEVTRAWQKPQIQVRKIVEDLDPKSSIKTIRLEIYNPGDLRVEGIEANVVEAKGPFEPHIGLPFPLTTKERLDRQRLLGQSIETGPFGIGGYEKKQIEVFRAHSPSATEGILVGQNGEATFIMPDQELAIEITGSQKPFRIVMRINEADDGIWSAILIAEAVGKAHGKGSVGQRETISPRHREILLALAAPLARAYERAMVYGTRDLAGIAAAKGEAMGLIAEIPYDESTSQTVKDFLNYCDRLIGDWQDHADERENRALVHRVSVGLFRFLHEGKPVDRAQIDLAEDAS